jgi:hypothetical protein
LPTAGSTPEASVLMVSLKAGSGNAIEFEAYSGGWGKFHSNLRSRCANGGVNVRISIN